MNDHTPFPSTQGRPPWDRGHPKEGRTGRNFRSPEVSGRVLWVEVGTGWSTGGGPVRVVGVRGPGRTTGVKGLGWVPATRPLPEGPCE